MSDFKNNIENISDGVISYLEFLELFKKVRNDDIITQEPQKNNIFTYIFRYFKLECYLIDKIYFDEFRKSINFNELINLLKPLNEENKKIFKIELKKYLDKNPYIPNGEKIELYSEINEMKEIVKNFNNYTFVNKELLNAMGVPESKLEGKMIKVSKNEKNISLLSISNNYLLSIKIEKKKENNDVKYEKEKENNEIKKANNKKYKNLYYLEEITKKIFILLYFNEKFIQNKLKKNIKDIYNFKKYYLINKEWLKEYKDFFLYDFVEKKIEYEYKNKNYSYNRIKHSLNNIVKKKFGQIKLFSETILSDFIIKAKNLKYHNKTQLIHMENNNETSDGNQINDNKQTFIIPVKYNLINEDLYKLLIKEEFFDNLDGKIGDIISFDALIGNSQIIIKNKATEENEEKFKYSNEYLIYGLKNKIEDNNIKDYQNKNNKEQNKENGDDDKFILKYILNYDDDNIFYNDLDKIMKEGLNSYFDYRKLDKDIKINNGILIKDEKDKYIGKFINIDLNEEDIKNDIGIKINSQIKENHIDSIEINSIKIKKNLENKETQTIINKNIEDNYIIENNDIKDINEINEIKENKENKVNKDNKIIYEKMIEKFNKERNEKNKEKTIYNNDKNKLNEFNENNNNINEVNNELNGKKNNEDKDNVINAIIEENKNENNIRKEEKNENIKNKKYMENSINEIKQREITIEKSFKDLCKNIIENKELNDIIISEEFLKNVNNPDLKQIILMDEESSKQFQILLNYQKLIELINEKEEKKKDDLIKNFHEEFNKIDNILSGKIELPNEIKLIDEFQKCKNNMNNKKKFQLFEKNKFIEIFKKGNNIFIYYFTYKNNSFIFFPKDKKILKLKL